ncbi:MAG: hypothetical protein ACKVT1_15855 [Dehalococcoidia bacterium]
MPRAFFGPPRDTTESGGLHVSVYAVPVFDGRLVVFDVSASVARGRWLPWAVIDFQQNPYEAASLLIDDWCDVPLADLALADVMSLSVEGGGWELAIIFRAVLTALPEGDRERRPYLFEPGHYDAIGPFDPVDLQRWVEGGADRLPPADLLF